MVFNIIYPVLRLIRELLPDCRNISPIIDDRMFVCCMVRDEALSKKIETKKTVETGDGKEITVDVRDDIFCDETLSNELYAFAFIDAGDSTCQDPVMRESILRRCVYGRWRDWGTIDIITHHSFIRLTGESKGIVDSVINPFLLQYITMAAGVLLQRATILQLSGECTEISEKYFDNKNPTRRSLKQVNEEIKTLKREYVYAQNTVFLEQFTVQEQGVDEFSMMKRELNIDDSLERLEQKINSLYEYTEEYSEEQENKLLNLIAYIGLPLALINLIVDMVGLPVFGEMVAENGFVEARTVVVHAPGVYGNCQPVSRKFRISLRNSNYQSGIYSGFRVLAGRGVTDPTTPANAGGCSRRRPARGDGPPRTTTESR